MAVAVAVGATLVVLGPNLPRLREAAIGARWSDALKHVWSQWWAWETVSSGAAPVWTDLLYAPDGGPFFSLDLANALLGAPLRGLLPPVAVYNLLLAAHLPLAFLSAWALARAWTGRPHAALVAGVTYAMSAWVLTFPLASGVTEAAFLWPLPLVLLCGWRTLTRPGWRAPTLGAALWVLQAVASTTFALVAGLGLLALVVGWAAAGGRPDRAVAARVARVLGLVTALALPLYLGVAGTVEGGVYERPLTLFGAFDPRALPEVHAVSLAQLVTPGSAGLRVHEGADRLLFTGYLGLTPLALAAVGSRRPLGRAAALAAALFVALALGPTLTVDLARAGPGWPNPVYLVAWWGLPLFSASMHGADRFLVGAALALGVGATVGLSALLDRAPRRLRGPLGIAAVALALAETLWASPAPWPVPQAPATPSPAAAALKGGAGPVLDLPFATPEGRFWSELLLDQTVHGRPVPYRLEGRGLQAVHPVVGDNPFFRAAHAWSTGRGSTLPCAGADRLAAAGFSDLVVHPDRLPDAAAGLPAALARCLGPAEPLSGALRFDLAARP